MKKRAADADVPPDVQQTVHRITQDLRRIQGPCDGQDAVKVVESNIYGYCHSCYQDVFLGPAAIYTNYTAFEVHYNSCKSGKGSRYMHPELKDTTVGRGDECETLAKLLEAYTSPMKNHKKSKTHRACTACGKAISVNDNQGNVKKHLQSKEVSDLACTFVTILLMCVCV